MKHFRRLRNSLLVSIAVLGILFLGVRLYLSSRFAAAQAAERLQDVLGAPVRVSDVNIGIGGDSTLQGLEVFEEGRPSDGPWVTIEDVRADVSALGMVGGRSKPSEVELGGAVIDLRFDKDGRLATRLPRPKGPTGAYPRFHLENSQITLAQAGREPMVVHGVNADLTDGNGRLNARGTIADPFWGDWTVEGFFVPEQGEVSLTLTTPRTPLTMQKLEKLPFVSPDVWKQVKLEGAGSVLFNLHFKMKEAGVHYRVELGAQDTQVAVTAIDLQADHASGQAIIEDGLVTLRDVRGQTADGEIATDADLDFRKKPAKLDFKSIEVHHVVLSKLPAQWSLRKTLEKARLDGRLTAKAALVVTLTDGQPHTQGEGKGQIADASIAGFATKRPIALRFTAEGKKFLFLPQGLTAAALVPGMVVALQPVRQEAAAPQPSVEEKWAPVQALEWLPRGAELVARGLTDVATAVIRHLPNFDKAAKADAKTSYLQASFALEDVDLALLIQRFNLRLPFPVSGRLSVDVQLAVPIDTPRDLQAYRFQGKADLPQLKIAGLEFAWVHARVQYRNGVLLLNELRGQFPPPGFPEPMLAPFALGPSVLGAAGSFAGDARLGIEPPGELTANVVVDRLPIGLVLTLLPSTKGHAQGSVSGTLQGKVPANRLSDPTAWTASGTLQSDRLMIDQFKVDALSLRWSEAAEGVKLSDLAAQLYGGKVTGSAFLPLRETATGSVDLSIANVDAAALTKAVPGFPFLVEGEVSGSVAGKLASAPGKPRELTTQVELAAPKLRVRGIPAEKLHGTVRYRSGAGDYSLGGELLGGKFKLEGKLPPRPETQDKLKEPEGRLQLEGVRLDRLWQALRLEQTVGPFRGVVALDLPFHYGLGGRPLGEGRFEIRDLRWNGTDVASTVQGDLRLTGDTLQFRNVSGALAGGTLRASLVLGLTARARSFFNVALEHADAAKLVTPFPGLAGSVAGTVEIRLRGSLGREWNGGGVVVLEHGKLFGAEVSEWRLPLDFGYVPERGSGQLDVRDGGAQIARGRATTRASLRWDVGGLRLEGNLRLIEADLRSLFGPSNGFGSIGAGRINARVEFGGSEIHSVDDLTATVEASFQQAQAFQVPVLQALTPFIVPGQSATTFQRGDLRARLSRGIVRVQRLTLTNPTIQMIVEGTVALSGRLNLDATARTGTLGINPSFLRLLGLKLPMAGPVPVALIAEVTSYLSNRVVHLSIGGAVRNPVVRVEPLPLLTEEAVRYFLDRANVPLP
jgi:hypothetical protein